MNSRKPLSRRRVQTPIGPLPTHWRIKQLGENAHIKARIGWRGLGADEYTNEGPLLIAGTHIRGSFIDWASCDHISDFRYEESPEIQLQENDVIFSKDGTLGRIGIVENLPGRATINGTMMLVRPNGEVFWPRYLYYYLQGRNFRRFIKEKVSGSSVPHIFQRDIVRMLAPVPPLPEQRKIAAILSSVDDAIEKTRAVIDQVQVVKRGLMQELLTRGLPGRHTRFEQTEIGEMPEEWGLFPLEQFIESGPDNGLYRPQSEYGEGIPIVRIDAFNDGDLLRGPNLRRVSIGPADVARFIVRPGDILINRVNSLSHLAKCALAVSFDEPTVYESNMMRLTLDSSRLVPEFGFRWLLSEQVKKHLTRRAKRAVAQASVNQNDVRTIPTPCPPRSEQLYVAGVVGSVEQRMEAETGALAVLNEVKHALMSVLLTGELRVAPDS